LAEVTLSEQWRQHGGDASSDSRGQSSDVNSLHESVDDPNLDAGAFA
jgi:hypothetical protein